MGRDAAGVIGIRLARQGDSVVGHERRPARERHPGPDRDRLRQARAADRVPAQASRRPGRRAHLARGPQDRRRRRGPAGHRGRRGAAPHQRRRPGHPDRDEHDQPLLVAAPAASSSCASPRATGSWPSPRSVPDLRSGTAWATMATPTGRTAPTVRPAREAGMIGELQVFGGGRPACTRTSSRSTTATRTRTSPGRSAATSAREPGKRRGLPVRQREHLRQDPGERPREGRLPGPADQPPGQPVDHGTADHDRRVQARQRRPDHRGHPVLRLRPLGQEGPAARPDHGPPDRRHDHRRRRGPGPDDGPPPGPDPGLLQHPGRRADRGPHALELLPPQAASRTPSSSRTSASPSAPGRSPSCSTRRSRSSRSGGSATSTAPS